MSRRWIVLVIAAVAVVSACASSHTTKTKPLTFTRFKADVQTLDQPFAKSPLPVDVTAAAARYDGFAASVQALEVEPSQIGEQATLVSAIHACSTALRAHPDLGSAQPSDYQACFTVQTLIQAMPT